MDPLPRRDTDIMTINEIAEYLDTHRVSAKAFWRAAAGGDCVPLRLREVVRIADEVLSVCE